MNMRLVLLLTHDRAFENLLTEVLGKNGSAVLYARNIAEAVRITCSRIRHLDLAIIDLDHGCRGMTLLSAIGTCRPDLRMMVAASGNTCRVATLAYANGATACVEKPISAAKLEVVIHQLDKPKPGLVAA
jgi:DNA-binding NtrC family response regulator